MGIWAMKLGLVFGSILVIEECIYYCWNRYVYGKKEKRRWLTLLIIIWLSLKLKFAKENQMAQITDETHSL